MGDGRACLRASGAAVPAPVSGVAVRVIRDPGAVPDRDGLRAWRLRRQDRRRGPRGCHVPAVPGARPARVLPDADWLIRGDLPDPRRPAVEPDLPCDGGDPARGSRRRDRQHRLDRGPPDPRGHDLRSRHRGIRRQQVLDDRARGARRGADGPGLRDADRRVHRDPANARSLLDDLPIRRDAAVPVQRDVLPDRKPAAAHPAHRVAEPVVARRRGHQGPDARHDRGRTAAGPGARCDPAGDRDRGRGRLDPDDPGSAGEGVAR